MAITRFLGSIGWWDIDQRMRNRRGMQRPRWDTWPIPFHLWGVVSNVAIESRVMAATVAEAAAGDAEALAVIVGVHHDDMARVAYVICGDQDRAQDAVQNAWPIAWRKLGSLRDPDSLRGWLMSIAVNEARQLMRRERRHPVTEIAVADIGSSSHDPEARTGSYDLASALRRLSIEDRAILALRHVAGFDATEIGRAVGMSASGVRSRLARLLTRLRSELDDD
jgi:RNA polymerase sigma-70 factor, ECF subfamily